MPEHSLPLPGQVGESFFSHAESPRNMETIFSPDGSGRAVGQCGDSISIDLKVDDDVIREIRIAPHGCIYTKACASAISELARGRKILRALEIEPGDVEHLLGGLPEDHMHCARLAVNTLGEAISDVLRRQMGHAG